MKEVCLVLTYKRDELLHCCLRRLRGLDGDISIIVFSDRRETSKNLESTCDEFEARLILQPRHSYHGNSFSAGEALRFAYLSGYELIHYVEDDCMVKADFFRWTRETHSDWDDIFCSCSWVFNHHMPIVDETYFAPWIYIPQFTIKRDKLALVIPHLNPLYFSDMSRYLGENFRDESMVRLYPQVAHYEIDGLLQRVIAKERLQVAWNGIARAQHCGAMGGYNKGGYAKYDEFFGSRTAQERIAFAEEFISDPHWRLQYFPREIVEREVGHEIPERVFRYKMLVPPDWECEFTSDLLVHQLPRRLNSVSVTSETKIVVDS